MVRYFMTVAAILASSAPAIAQDRADGLFNDRIRVLVARSGSNWALLHIAEGPDRSQIYQLIVEDSNAGIN